jgi:type IV pilus assembly protein PilA
MENWNGFTLLELMIVVTLIMIIAAIAIPCLTTSKISANEASAVASIHAINTAELTYAAIYGGYADSLANLGGPDPCTKSAETACLLDQSLAGGLKAGYRFMAVGGSSSGGHNTTYVVGAAPEVFDRTGHRLFCSTDKGVIRTDLNTSGSTITPSTNSVPVFRHCSNACEFRRFPLSGGETKAVPPPEATSAPRESAPTGYLRPLQIPRNPDRERCSQSWPSDRC